MDLVVFKTVNNRIHNRNIETLSCLGTERRRSKTQKT